MSKLFKSLYKVIVLTVVPCVLSATSLFDVKEPFQDGLNVVEVSNTFTDIFEQLDSVKWGGKDIRIALEALEKIDANASIALTDNRAFLVWKGDIVGNWPRPADRDWKAYGEIATAMILRLREKIPSLRDLSENRLYETVVGALMKGVDEDGRYIYSKRAEIMEDGRLLTSVGIDGLRDERGNFRVTGVFMGGLADVAGIRAGDLIMEINGVPMMAMQPGEITAAFSGFNSGTVKILVANESGTRPVVLRRTTVLMTDADIIWKEQLSTSKDQEQEAGILEIIVHRVSDGAVAIINEALGKYPATGIVLDLRASGGDDERAAAKITGLFMGAVPVLRSTLTAQEEIEVTPGGDAVISEDIPIVVVVSGATQGTAEAIASAMYENKRGVLIGTPTAGRARLATRLGLKNGGELEVMNRVIKTGAGRIIDGRGVFPIVCLSNIRSNSQREAFFLNVTNGNFGGRDFNREENIDPDAIRKGCPAIRSGADEDAAAAAVAAKILTDSKIYDELITK
ncbi:MAG: S41 family peptidase [Alphaproteobacteria bacterium]|nr:S41 family peptidase [Alphaproteobacteria bacterium]